MDRVALLQRYQSFNPATGEFDLSRTNRDFARLIGVHESYLSKGYDRQHPIGVKALEGLRRAFPQEAATITELFFADAAPSEVGVA
jgi:hypothetical protein